MTGNKETVSSRIPQDDHRRLQQYAEERGITQSDAVRRLIRIGLEREKENAENAEREDRLQILARLGEKVSLVGILLAFLTLAVPIFSSLAVTTFDLTIGQFGAYLVLGITLLLAIASTVLVGLSLGLVIYLLTRYGIENGWFGRHLKGLLDTPEPEVTP